MRYANQMKIFTIIAFVKGFHIYPLVKYEIVLTIVKNGSTVRKSNIIKYFNIPVLSANVL